MEKNAIKRVKERETETRRKLLGMIEDAEEYRPPVRLSAAYHSDKSEESSKQKKRESTIFAVQYVKESQIPLNPKELEEKYFNESSDDVMVIKIVPPIKRVEVRQSKLLIADKQFENNYSSQLTQALARTLINTISGFPQSQVPIARPQQVWRFVSAEDAPKPPNYRTVPCRLFHSSVGCSRGSHCNFIHDEKYPGREIPQAETVNKWRFIQPFAPSQYRMPSYQISPQMMCNYYIPNNVRFMQPQQYGYNRPFQNN